LNETIRKVKNLYEKGKGKESMHKSWKDKKKEKYDQRRKGFKPPFNRNIPTKNYQDQYVKDEFIGTGVDPGFNSYNAPTNPNYYLFQQHLRSK
jgi:hypothetical protein